MIPTYDKELWRASGSKTAELLETLRTREIASMTDEQALDAIRSLVTAETPWSENANYSGLIEQQAIFHRNGK